MNLEELKAKLSEFIGRNSISKFGPDDVLELIAEGESIEWIAGQLTSDSRIDACEVTPLLTEIGGLVAPGGTPVEAQATEVSADDGISESNREDWSRLDLTQIGEMLPEGVPLPPGMDLKEIKGLLESPQGKVMADFVAFCQEKGIDLSQGDPRDSRTGRLRTEWMSTPREAFEGKTPAEMLSGVQGRVETFRRTEPHVGRNDPCPCGSGKKYKKCCGRA